MFNVVLILGLLTVVAIIVQIFLGKSGPSGKRSHINYFWIVVVVLALVHIILAISLYGN
ncbi:MAG: hypothetical protein BWY43_00748 [candidate division WS2 bacterium ADurb.Bin280]|uniref:Uncharacterized protein n=1 Tax=candidate division WS2 bacterium ADurb.Bin280 TaxID=1852829 RepID=A0A1V5SBR7_9BACT|nr:MAG: hypothetical protein BWY43_00748 [candidate division WS2 bacterium ADurb.Bin280]